MKPLCIKLSSLLTVNVRVVLTKHFCDFKTVLSMKYLNVAEKNDAAKNIAGHLSRGTSKRREGLSQFNKIYEFEATVQNQRCTMVMTSVSGHLLGLEFVAAYRNWQSCNPLSLFEAPVYKMCPENYQKIKKTLEREIRHCQGLIIWTDCDREGENIGFEIIQVCTEAKPNLKIFRAKFSEITAASVGQALQTLGEPNRNVSDAVDVRQELDLRIGAAFTRFQTLRLQKVFPSKLADNLVSYGSCQFPTLGFVVERYRAIEKFIPESFWKIKVSHTIDDLTVDFIWERGRLFDDQACRVLHDICIENPLATVLKVQSKPKNKWRPLPLDTIELEKTASRKLKINAKETMRIAEKLYTQGFISYPRTETNQYPSNMNLGSLVQLQTPSSEWGSFAQRILDSGGPTPRQGNKSDQAHPPIHPTKFSDGLSGNEKRVYEFIVRSFLACCSKDAQGQETTVQIDISQEKFNANGLMIIERNYLEVYPYDKWSAKQLHIYQMGQQFTPTQVELADGQTSPPSLLTEADLIALMEKHGIGTDATHADHIETIKSRSYVALTDNVHFIPGLLGMGLVDGYDAMGLPVAKPNLRAQLEADLKDICEGRKRPEIVLAQQVAKYREVYMTVTAEAIKIDQALAQRFNENPIEPAANEIAMTNAATFPKVMKCPKCGTDMILKMKKDAAGWFISCMGYPQCKNAVWFPAIVDVVKVLDTSCNVCGPNFKKLEFKWKSRDIAHLYPPPYTSCIGGCDMAFLEILNVNLSSVKPSNATNSNVSLDSGVHSLPRSTTSIVSNTQNAPANTTRPNNYPSSSGFNNFNGPSITNNRDASGDNFISRDFNGTNNSGGFRNSGRAPRGGGNSSNGWDRPNSTSNNPQTGWDEPNINSNPQSRWNGSNVAQSDDNGVLCSCNKAAVLLTVKKTNQNFGRKFYKCQQPKESGGCEFFLWAPDDGGPSNSSSSDTTNQNSWGVTNTNNHGTSQPLGQNNQSTRGPRDNSVASSNWGSWSANSDSDAPNCKCNLSAKKVTVQKEGPNKGRPFYGCPNPVPSRCTFFQWADEAPTPSLSTTWGTVSTGDFGNQQSARGGQGSSRGGSRGTRGRGARGAGPHSEGSKRKCGLCRQEGHTRARCPQLQ